MANPISGQLWYVTNGGDSDTRVVRVNSDGSSQTINVDNGGGPEPIPSGGGVVVSDVGIDTVAGVYFIIVQDPVGGNSAQLLRGIIGSNAAPVRVDVGGNAFATDDIVNAMQIDAVNRKIYVGYQDQDVAPGASGIKVFSYDATGTLSGGGFFVTAQSDGRPDESGLAILNPRDFALDSTMGAGGTLFYTELMTDLGDVGLFRVDISTGATTQLVPQAQFLDDGSNGFIRDVEVDKTTDRVYFSTQSYSPYDPNAPASSNYNASQNAIYWIAENANGATNATKVTLSGAISSHFYPGDMTFDQSTRQLYVESQNDGGVNSDNVIYVFQLDGSGDTATLLRTITPDAFTNAQATIKGLAFVQLPTLGLSGTSAAAVEQATNGTLVLAGAPTLTDDGGYLKGATVQITSGTFVTGETSAADDHLGVGAVTKTISGTISGTSITVSWNAATETLTLSGVDTVAHYQSVLNQIAYWATGDNPTNYGANTSRTLTWTVDDGTLSIPAGSSNTTTSTINVSGQNDAPVNTVSTSSGAEDAVNIAVTGLHISDVDADPASASMTVTLSVGSGAITLLTNVGGGLSAGQISGNATGTVVLTGTQNQINATLAAANAVKYAAEGDFNGTVNLSMVTSDGGLSDTDSHVITITAVNDAPTVGNDGTEILANGTEDTNGTAATVLSIFQNQFDDSIDAVSGGSSAHSFAGVAVIDGATSSAGDWQYNNGGTWTNIGAVSDASAVLLNASAQIRFVPAANYNGPAPTLEVRLIDSSGAAFTDGAHVSTAVNGGTTRYSADTVTLDQAINAVNDAPVSDVSTLSLATVVEDAAPGAGETVSSLFGSHFSDVKDGGSAANLAGIAVTANAASGSNGVYQYFDGSDWVDFPAVSTTGALVLSANTLVRFLPVADWSGTPGSLTVHLIEDSSGSVTTGATANLTTVGGATQYSTSISLGVTVTGSNDAPVASGAATLADVAEGAANPAGATVASLFGGSHFSDPDGDTLGGVLITHNNATGSEGSWQYYDGATWQTIGSPSDGSAIYLTAATLVRFLPNGNFNGAAPTLNAHLVDSTATGLTLGAPFDASVTGGQTHYSANTVTLSTNVTAVNDAPLVGGDGTEVLSAGTEDANGTPVTVSSVFFGQFSDSADTVSGGSTANSFAGVAVVGNTSTGSGEWQYNAGGVWTNIGPASNASSVLLNAATEIRFAPAADFNGSAPTLQVRLVDSSGGAFVDGAHVSTASNGGATPYSTSLVTLNQTVDPVNDAPTVTNGAAVSLNAVAEDSGAGAGATVLSLFNGHFSDVTDGSASTLAGIAITGNAATTQGKYQYGDGATWTDIPAVTTANAFVIDAGTQVRFVPAADYSGTAPALTVSLIESSVATVATGDRPDLTTVGGSTIYSTAMTLNINVTPVNDAPVASGAATLAPVAEGSINPVGATVASLFGGSHFSDIDGDTLAGVAVTANHATGAEGVWQYYDGATWVTISSSVSDAASLYLTAATLVRFLPNGSFNGAPPTLEARLVDSTVTGLTFEATPDVSVNGGVTHFSANTVVLSTSVDQVNDAPVVPATATGVAATEQTAAVLLGGLAVSDPELGALNGGLGDFAGASFTIQRTVANVDDGFGFSTAGASFTVSGANIQVGGQTVATFTSTGGVLTINFTSTGATATTALVNEIIDHVTYTNGANAPPASVSLDYTLNDGGNQGIGGALHSSGAVTVTLTGTNDLPTGSVTATGTTTENETLTADTSLLVDTDGLGTLNYEWQRGTGSTFTTIASATNSTYTLGDADVGQTVRVVVTYTDVGGTAETFNGTPTATIAGVNDPHTGAVTVTGTETEDQQLTAVTTALADVDGLGTFSYEWQRGSGSTFTAIAGATGATYNLGDADVGETVRVKVTYTDLQGFAESETSGATGVITNVNDAPTGSVTISGTTNPGQTLTAGNSLVDNDGLGTITYQWKSNGVDIVGATGATYALSAAEVGKAISVSASYTDLHGTPESVVSSAVNVTAPEPPTTTTGTVIDGAPVEVTKTTNPDGSVTQTTNIATVTPSATGQTADIPLFSTSNGESLLSVSAPVGYSMTISGSDTPRPAADSFNNLVTAIQAAGGDTSQTGAGGSFLTGPASGAQVLVQSVTPTVASDSANLPLTFIGNPAPTGVFTALVLDVTHLPSGTVINLQNIDFVTIIGAVQVGGGDGSQTVFGDDENQIIVLGADDDVLHGGGGNDTVGSKGGNDKIYGDSGDDTLFGGEGNDLMDGGVGNDTVLMGGNLKDYMFVHTGQGLTSISFEGDDTMINVETLKMTDGSTVTDLNKLVQGTTSVAVMTYQFFTGKTPTAAGLEYLLHAPDTVNAGDLSDAYYTKFNVDNRYINFAINLASPQGQAHAWFETNYGALNFEQTLTKAYQEIFGVTLTTDRIDHLLYDQVGPNQTRLQFFEAFAGSADGAKAGIIGWLLAAAVLENTGRYAAANTAFLNDFADGDAKLNVDLVGVYGDGHAWGSV